MPDDDRRAGDFASWIGEMRAGLRYGAAVDVPCAGCTACCRSSQFVLIEADEHDTTDHIPPEYLFPAPRMPEGSFVLGHGEDGACPMLGPRGCSIYEFRPRACRVYDCRVFTACGIYPEGEARVMVAKRAKRWQFSFSSEASRAEIAAVRRAADFLLHHPDALPAGAGAPDVTQVAGLAVSVSDVFGADEQDPDPADIRAELRRRSP
jgi:Fe-S-cluster containining protein